MCRGRQRCRVFLFDPDYHVTLQKIFNISFLDKTQIPAKDIWVPDMDIMSLTSVGESSKIEKELVTIRKTGRVSVFKRIFYEGITDYPRLFRLSHRLYNSIFKVTVR